VDTEITAIEKVLEAMIGKLTDSSVSH